MALFVAVPASAQDTGTIIGQAVDVRTMQPLASVQVSIAELGIGVLTQQNGRYILTNVPVGTHTVHAQRIGYGEIDASITVAAGQSVSHDFQLEEQALALNEIVVTGTPGGTQMRALGNSVERVSAAEITEQTVVTDVQDLLEARTPGLRFDHTSGEVGGGSGITIRGVSSVSLGSQPLIYIDGIRVDNDATKGPDTGSSSGNGSALGSINPDNIESIEVIKGPAAATLYGTEASAGVIQIITKKGSIGAPQFTFEIAGGTNFMVDPQGVLGTQYACSEVLSPCPKEKIVEYHMYDEANDYLHREGAYANVPGTPREADLFGYGRSQKYSASVRGGTDQVRYFLSGTWNDDVGIIDYNTDTGTNLRANVTVLLTDALRIDASTGFAQGHTQFMTVDGEGGVWHQLVWSRGYNIPGVRTPEGSGFLGFQERFPESYENTDISRDWSRFTGSVTATHNYNDWLDQRLVVGIDRGWETDTEYLPPNMDFADAPDGSLTFGRPINQNVTFDYSASGNYDVTESLGTTTSVGAQYYTEISESVENTGLGFPTSVQKVIDATEFSQRTIDFSHIENKSLGFYLQEEFAWNDRIYLTGAVRADDNSAFGANFDLQYYPKVSASWVISEEPFFNLGLVNNLRLRGAWGQSGRQPSTFASQNLFNTYLGPDGNGLVPSTAGNPDIGPEVSSELEIGFDVAMLDQRLTGEFSYYTRKTEDMLVNQALAPSTGLTGSRDVNFGTMKAWGWEASVNARLVEEQSVAFDLNLAGDYTTNELTALGEGVLPTGNLQIGWPYPNVSTGYKVVDAAFVEGKPGVVDRASVMCDGGVPAVDGGPNIMPGGEIIPCSDYHEEGILLGPAYPNYTFTVGPTLTLFNNLRIFALAQGQFGRWISSTDAQYACQVYANCKAALLKNDPVQVAGQKTFTDDRYIGRYAADFWKLREIGLNYTLPQSLVSRTGADRMSVSLSGSNLWTIWQANKTDHSGANIFDPTYSNNGGSQTALWEMPSISSINASINVTF